MSSAINGIEIDITLVQGRNLMAKDSKGMFSKKKTSDPYAIIYWGGEKCGKTKTIDKTLNPQWNETFKIKAGSQNMSQLLNGDPKYSVLDIVIFDDDKLSKDETLGTVSLPLNFMDHPTNLPSSWYTLGKGKAPYIAKDVSGELEIKLAVQVERIQSKVMQKGEAMQLNPQLYDQTLTLNIGWDVPRGTKPKKVDKVEPHASAICFDRSLNLVDIASFKDKRTRDDAIKHCGTGKGLLAGIMKKDDLTDLGENITFDLDKVSQNVTYVCCVINSFKARDLDLVCKYDFTLFDPKTKNSIAQCAFSKSTPFGPHSALFMCCIYRDLATKRWMICPIADVAPGIETNDVVDALQKTVHQKLAYSTPAPARHSDGPRAALVVDC